MKEFFFKFLSIFISIFFLFFILEIFLFFENYSPKYKTYYYKLLNYKIKINEDFEKLSKEKNIRLALGDSFTQGKVCAGKQQDFVSQLNSIQKKRFYNMGIENGNPIRYIKVLEDIKIENVSEIILTLYYNDINIDKSSCFFYKFLKDKIFFFPKKCDYLLNTDIDSSNNTFFKKVDNFFELKSNVWLLAREALANIHFFNKYYNRSDWVNYFENELLEENKALINDLKYIQSLAKINNINLFILYYPDVNYLKEDNQQIKTWKKFIQTASKNSIIINDPWNFFLDNKIKKNMSWSLIDKHPSCDAHTIMANYINKTMLKH